MRIVAVFDLLQRRVLVTGDSARSVKQGISLALIEGQGEAVLDFSGMRAVTPSIFDETLMIIEECANGSSGGYFRVTINSPPTSLSSAFEAVARAHEVTLEESERGDWVITKATPDMREK